MALFEYCSHANEFLMSQLYKPEMERFIIPYVSDPITCFHIEYIEFELGLIYTSKRK